MKIEKPKKKENRKTSSTESQFRKDQQIHKREKAMSEINVGKISSRIHSSLNIRKFI